MPEVLFEKSESGVGLLTLSEPDALNAMDEVMAQVFRERISTLQSEKLKAIIITGAGRAFSAGGNLEMLEVKTKLSKEENVRKMLEFYDSFLCIRSLGVPLIAAVNGHAIGAGLCLTLACDIRVVAEEAKLGMTFTKLGLHPGMGGTYFLPKVLGNAQAAELLLTGRVIRGEDVLRYGLSRELHPSAKVVARAYEIAEEISCCGPEATKQLVQTLRGDQTGLIAALEREAHCQSENYASAEFLEGVRSVQEKRKPNF